MIAFSTTDDWLTAEIEINDGATIAQFYGVAGDSINSAMDALVIWADATFVPTFAWTWAREAATGGAIITLTATGGTFTLEATNAEAQAAYGLAAGVHGAPSASVTFDSVASGTWAPVRSVGVRTWQPLAEAAGYASGVGVPRTAVDAYGHARPSIEAACNVQDSARLAGILPALYSPRSAYVWHGSAAVWRNVTVGKIDIRRGGYTTDRVTIEAVSR